MSSMSQLRKRSDIEKGMKGGKLLDFFANNPKGHPFEYTKERTMINVSLPAITVAAVSKSDEANKKKEE